MNLRKYYPFIVLLLFCCQPSTDDSQLIATVGNRKISIAEFKDRINFNPVLGNTSPKQHKENVLNSIVAEALLSQMQETSLSEVVSLLINQKNREAVIETLWDEIVFKNIQVSDSALWSFYLKSNKQREIEFAVFDDSINAKNFYAEWLKNNQKAQSVVQKDTLGFAGNIAILEKEVFNAEIGKISKPVKVGRKYLVHKTLQEWEVGLPGKQDFNQKFKSVKKQYLKYTKQKRFYDYSRKTFKNQNYQLDKTGFKKLTHYLEAEAMQEPSIKSVNKEILNFSRMEGFLDPNIQLVKFINGEDWTIRKFLKHLAVSPYPLNYSSNAAFRYSMIRASKRILDDELLYREAIENNLDEHNYVKWQTDMWMDFYKAQKIASSKKYSKRLKETLDSLKVNSTINIKWQILDTLTYKTSNMMVLKTHFPGQTIVPRQNNWKINVIK